MSRNQKSRQGPPTAHPRYLIGYARVSTQDQDLARQIDALKAHGCKESHIYTDKASGRSMRRKGLEEALLDCRPGDVLVAVSVDRLSRSLKDLIALSERLQANHIELRILHQNVDTTTPMGRAFFHIIAVIAELERSLIGERTRHGMEVAARERGQKYGPLPTFAKKHYPRAIKLLKSGMSAEAVGKHFSVTGQVIRIKLFAEYGKKFWTPKKRKQPKRR